MEIRTEFDIDIDIGDKGVHDAGTARYEPPKKATSKINLYNTAIGIL
jgi:hypothetical protein